MDFRYQFCKGKNKILPEQLLLLLMFFRRASGNRIYSRIAKVVAYGENQRSTCETEVKF